MLTQLDLRQRPLAFAEVRPQLAYNEQAGVWVLLRPSGLGARPTLLGPLKDAEEAPTVAS